MKPQLMIVGVIAMAGWAVQATEREGGTNTAAPPEAMVLGKPLVIEKVKAAGPTASADVSLRSAYVSRGRILGSE